MVKIHLMARKNKDNRCINNNTTKKVSKIKWFLIIFLIIFFFFRVQFLTIVFMSLGFII
jgi:hypothetical protein